MNKHPFFFVLTFFNFIFLLNGLAFIAAAIYLIITNNFNSLSFIMIIIGIIIVLIFILGLKVSKKIPLIVMYLLFVMVFFLFYGVLLFMIKFFPNILIDFLKRKLPYTNNVDFNIINEYNFYLFVITCIGTACCFLADICSIIYCCILKIKRKKRNATKELFNDYSNHSILPENANRED